MLDYTQARLRHKFFITRTATFPRASGQCFRREAYVPEVQSAGQLNTAVFDSGEQFATYRYTFDESACEYRLDRYGIVPCILLRVCCHPAG